MRRRPKHDSRLGEFLERVTPEQVAAALAMQRGGDSRLFGVLLVECGFATREEVDRALLLQRARRGQLAELEGVELTEGARSALRSAAETVDELVESVTRRRGR